MNLKRKTNSVSSKTFFSLASLIIIIPLTVLVIFFNFYTVNILKHQVSSASKNALHLYYQKLNSDLSQLELLFSHEWVQNYEYQKLQYVLDPIEAHTDTLQILNDSKETLSLYSCVGAVYIFSRPNGICRGAYNSPYSFDQKEAMQKYVSSIAYRTVSASWYTDSINGKNFLIRVLGLENAFTVCMIDFDLIEAPAPEKNNPSFEPGSLIYLSDKGVPLNHQDFLAESEITLSPSDDSVIKHGSNGNYFAVRESLLDDTLFIYYLTPYQGSSGFIDNTQIFACVFSVLALLLIPLAYYIAVKFYFIPLSTAISTMKKIRSGNLDLKLPDFHIISEFSEFNQTFNSMMDEIKLLKIHTYEHMLAQQKAELQYLQMQLKPHFYLNCLKTLYGMIQKSKTEKAQQMILHVSDYIRYTFRDNNNLVSLETELNHVKNYYELLQFSTATPAELNIDVPPGLYGEEIPLLCIQTFVENAFKYGIALDHSLSVQISIHKLLTPEGNYLNISIQDNGPGFSSEFLNLLNKTPEVLMNAGTHIGICNLRQRLQILYGDKAGLICINNHLGALAEIILPAAPAPAENSSFPEV